ncbi:MAG: small ribosomal subunit protein uS17, partial [Patescibacteria group bacterium]
MANKPRNLKVKKVEKSVSSLSLKPRFNKQGKAVRRKAGKEVIGRVVSAKMAKTVVVVVNRLFRHPLYKKAIRRTKRFLVHNEGLILNVG